MEKIMDNRKVLWLEDQAEGLKAYRTTLFREGFLVDNVKSVSKAVKKLTEKDYLAFICDIKVLPGNDKEWIELDKKKRRENPHFDSVLGLELLNSLFKPGSARVTLSPPVEFNPRRMIVLSVVYDSIDEISALGIPKDQIVYKSDWDFTTLPRLIKKIQDECI
jgi:CheY-like chemotaxis protein